MRNAWQLALLGAICAGVSAQSDVFDLSAGGEPKIRKGWPLMVSARVFLLQEGAATIEVKEGRPWTAALRAEMRDEAGQLQAVEWELLDATRGPLRFDEDAAEAAAVLALSPEATGKLSPGTYRISVVLDTVGLAAKGAWSGKLIDQRLKVEVVEEAEEQQGVLGHRLQARWLDYRGQREAALAEIDAALKASPEDLVVLLEKADLLMAQGRNEDAASVLQAALALFRNRHGDATHPPREILRRLQKAGW